MRLNRSQRLTIMLGGLGVLIMLVFPPWVFTIDMQSVHMRMDAGYALIFDPPKPDAAWKKGTLTKEGAQLVVVRIDIVRLLIQVAAAGMGTALLMFLFHHRKAVAP